MATVRNISADRRHVPLLDRDVDPDELVEVPDELVWEYAWPADTWDVDAPVEPVDVRTVAQLRDELRAAGLPLSGTKQELVRRLASAGGGE